MPTPVILITTARRAKPEGFGRLEVVGGQSYAEAIVTAGGLPVFAPNPEPSLAEAYLERVDGLLLSGGGDIDPAHFGALPDKQLGYVDAVRDAFELALYRAAKRQGKPVLGICRGLQVINVAEGGTLYQHLPDLPFTHQHSQQSADGGPLHRVTLMDSQLARAIGRRELAVNSYHHQAIERLGDNLQAVAHSADGIIEAIEGTGSPFVLGVQWHPELRAGDPEQLAPFKLLVQAASAAAR